MPSRRPRRGLWRHGAGAIGGTVAFVPVLLSPFRSLEVAVPPVEPTAAADDELRPELGRQVADA
jgi:hypothetical protein